MLWLNDRLADPVRACIDPADRGFLLGDGLFETLAVFDGTPRHLERHLDRLARGCALLDLPVPDRIDTAIDAVIAANRLEQGSLRLTWTRGPGPRGLLPPDRPAPTLLVTATPGAAPTGPVRLVTATVTRRNEQSPLCQVKHLNALDTILARQEARSRDADGAILLNTVGRVAETCIANLFVRIGKHWVTPPAEDGALPGVMRAGLLEDGQAEERRLTPDDLATADAACLTNALGIRAVSEIDGRVLSGESLCDECL